jgi:phage-related protein
MKKAVYSLLLLLLISNTYAMPVQSVSIADDIIDSVKDGIVGIINAVIDVIKSLFKAVADAITYPFKLLGNNFKYSSNWWNSTLGGFSPIGYVVVIALTIGLIFWFVDKYVTVGLG